MIELNLTYGESKKILELGYDFSSICKEFMGSQYQNYFGVHNTSLNGEFSITFYQIWDTSMYETLHKNQVKDYYTPIIPKAALSECFMGFTFYEETEDRSRFSHTYQYRQYPKNRFEAHYPSIETELHPISHLCRVAFSSVFEAFIWGHDKFPKQLKKKFDEVMA